MSDPSTDDHEATRLELTETIEVSELVGHTRADTERIAVAVERFGTDAPVAHCGDWHVGDVARHLGVIHRWAAEVVRSGRRADRLGSGPDVDGALPEWLRDGADELCSALTTVPPETECWTFGGPPGRAGFWASRQSLETAIHRFDVEHAVGLSTRISTDLAVAGISEVVDFLFPRQVQLGRAKPLPGRVALIATDVPARWELGDPSAVEAAIGGPASALLLMLWKRPHSSLTREGDELTLAALAATAVTP